LETILLFLSPCFSLQYWGLNSRLLKGLLHRHSTTWATLPSPICFHYFWNRVSCLCLGQPKLQSFCTGRTTGMHHHAKVFIGWVGDGLTFGLGQPSTTILPMSTS
jgi:hypothetical protein